MKIEWLGHACFRLTTASGTVVVTDPYKSGCFDNALRYGPVDAEAHLVTVSHDHEDHWDAGAVRGNPRVLDRAGSFEHRDVRVTGVDTDHDTSGGAERGHNVVFRMDAEDLSVVHLGDLGHVLTPEQAEAVGRADVLLAPVGGHFTIDPSGAREVASQLAARIVVPMHFKTDKVDFPIGPVEAFLEGAGGVMREGGSAFEVTVGALPEKPEIRILIPAR